MTASVTCYPIPGKPKAALLCEAFAAGVVSAGGRAHICRRPPAQLAAGAAVFYGVRPAVAHLWAQAKAERRDWYYIDNSYFDVAREREFRVTRNAVQLATLQTLNVAEYDGQGGMWFVDRLRELGVTVAPWRRDGGHIVVCAQSDEYLRVVAEWRGNWLEQTVTRLRQLTPRRLIVRRKGAPTPLAVDLKNAWALVTHASAAAVEAALAGVPVFVTGTCAAKPVAMNRGVASFARLEERPEGYDVRRAWAEGLARNQWSLNQIEKGRAWTALNA